MTTPHILFVDDYPLANIGGGEQHLLRIARGCREWGYRVGIVCAQASGLEEQARAEGFEVWPLRIGSRYLGSRRRLTRLFRTLSPDLVHAHGFHATLTACPAARASGVIGVYATVHNMPSAPLELRPGVAGKAEFWLRALLYRRVARSVGTFVCVVNAARDELIELGLDPAELTVIANGIPDPMLRLPEPPVHDAARIVIGSAGRLEPLKGYQYFVSAASVALRKADNQRFRLVGDGRLRRSLEQQADELDLGDRFAFVGWSDEPLTEIAAMDIYVASSVTDTTNLTILEAMALGKPVIASNVGGISDAVVDGVSGYLVAPRQIDVLAQRMLDLAADAALRISMGAAGRERFEEFFTEDRMLAQHRDMYDRVLTTSS